MRGAHEFLKLLLDHRSFDVNSRVPGRCGLIEECSTHETALHAVQLLSSRGAIRLSPTPGFELPGHLQDQLGMAVVSLAEQIAAQHSNLTTLEWLVKSRGWCTELHHVSVLDVDRVRMLLHRGDDPYAAGLAPHTHLTPLDLAKRCLEEAGGVGDSAAALVVRACELVRLQWEM